MIHERIARRLASRTDLGIAVLADIFVPLPTDGQRVRCQMCGKPAVAFVEGYGGAYLKGLPVCAEHQEMMTRHGRRRQAGEAPPHVVVWFYSPGWPKPITEITAEVAASPRKRAIGLSQHKVLHPTTGMLFLQPSGPAERHEVFHVGGVQFPFDLIFVRRDHRIGKIVHNVQPDDAGHWGYRRTSAVVEVVGGFCKSHGIKLGDEIGFGTLRRAAFDGQTECPGCGSMPPAGDWSSPDGMCEACAERREGRLSFDANGRVCKANGEYCDACNAHAPGQLKPIFTDEEPPDIKFLCPACKKADVYGCEPGESMDERAAQIEPCNCENSRCLHERACPNPAGSHRVMYVGAVCDDCWQRMPAEYRLAGAPMAPVSDVPSADPVQTQPKQQAPKPTGKAPKTARDPEEDERKEMPPPCSVCGSRDPEWTQTPDGKNVCSRCADELAEAEEREGQAQTHDLLRTITEASRRAQNDDVRCPQCDEPVGPGGSCDSCGASFAEFEQRSASVRKEAAFPAKFRGTCKVCGQYIDVGAMINWSKAAGASHQSCGQPSGGYGRGYTPGPGGRGGRPRSRGCDCADPGCDCLTDRCMCDHTCNCRGGYTHDC